MISNIISEEIIFGDDGEIRQKLGEIFKNIRKSRRSSKVQARVLFLVDNYNWCWTTTARNIVRRIPEYKFQIESASEFRKHSAAMLEMCDVVYMRGYPFAFLDGLPEIKKPFIWTLSTGGENLDMRISQSIGYAKKAAACIVQCERARREAEIAGIKNIHSIPNGVDIQLFRTISATEKKAVVGFAGNSDGERGFLKGIPYIKEACEKLGVSYAEVNKANRLSYEQMPEFYNSIQIYAQPSNSEGCSNSVFEAMACGIPCLICEGVGYHGEVCSSDSVVFVKRDSADIAEKIKWLMDNPTEYSKISANARKFAEAHSWEIMARRHHDMMDGIISELANNDDEHKKPEQKQGDDKRLLCCLCRYFFALRDIRDCGLCIRDSEMMILKYRTMICCNYKNRKE